MLGVKFLLGTYERHPGELISLLHGIDSSKEVTEEWGKHMGAHGQKETSDIGTCHNRTLALRIQALCPHDQGTSDEAQAKSSPIREDQTEQAEYQSHRQWAGRASGRADPEGSGASASAE